MPSRRQWWKESVHEFFSVLSNPFTYSPRKNPEIVFGFLWGLPIPIFTFAIHMYAAGLSCHFGTCTQILWRNPAYIVFILHPLLFAVVFGALGTMRARREGRIRQLLDAEKRHGEELCRANTRLQELDQLKSEFLANV